MLKEKRIKGKIYKKNRKLIFGLLISFSAVIVLVLSVFSFYIIKKDISTEKTGDNNEKIKLFENYASQYEVITSYFSSVTIFEDGSDWYINSDWYIKMMAQIEFNSKVLNNINGVLVSKNNYTYVDEIRTGDISNLKKEVKLGSVKQCDVYAIDDNEHLNSMYFVMWQDKNLHTENDVIVSIDTYSIGKKIYGEKASESCIVNSSGDIIISNSISKYGQNIKDIYGRDISSFSDGKLYLHDGRYIIKEKIDGMELYAVHIDDSSQYLAIIQNFVIIIVLGITVLILLFMIISRNIFIKTYKPIEKVIELINATNGEFDGIISYDEISYINSKFEQLYYTNKDLSSELSEKMRDLKEQQIIALQSQVNPHFIFNTLEFFNGMALEITDDYENPISNGISKMAKILYEYMNINEILISLDREIDILKSYIEILQMRNRKNPFKVNWDIDKTVLNHKVLKACLQVLIENAFYHGICECRGKGEINISIYTDQEYLNFSVEDNGAGMDEAELEELRNSIYSTKAPQKHIGLFNLNLRLNILYGPESRINIDSKKGVGTKVFWRVNKNLMR